MIEIENVGENCIQVFATCLTSYSDLISGVNVLCPDCHDQLSVLLCVVYF